MIAPSALLVTIILIDAVIGDVHLIPTHTAHYEVQVYFGDGLQAPSWVGICKDRAYNVDNVICRQLGYNGGKNLTFSV